MLGDFQADGWQLENLPAFAVPGLKLPVRGFHRRAAFGTTLIFAKPMLDNVIGMGNLFEGIAAAAFLPSALAG